MSDPYVERILKARVYDVAIESALDPMPRLSARIGCEVLLKREDTGSRPALAPATGELVLRVLIRHEGGSDVVYPLGRRTSIGRTVDNDIQVDTTFISRHHAVLLSSPDHCIVEDLNSTNGVLVNGHRIGRQGFGDIVVEHKQLAQSVAVLCHRQAAHEPVLRRRSGAGEGEGQVHPRHHLRALGGAGLVGSGRRHGSFADAAIDPLPGLHLAFFHAPAQPVDPKARGSGVTLVASHAVLIEKRAGDRSKGSLHRFSGLCGRLRHKVLHCNKSRRHTRRQRDQQGAARQKL
jgi:pSer/pThr/pTyr-binding forkhead associated (FHA) protein